MSPRNHAAATAEKQRTAKREPNPFTAFKVGLFDALNNSNHVVIHSDHGLIPLYGSPSDDTTKGNIKAITFYKEEESGEYIELKGLVNIKQEIEVCESSGAALVHFISLTVENSMSSGKKLSVNTDSCETIAFANKAITPLRLKDVR